MAQKKTLFGRFLLATVAGVVLGLIFIWIQGIIPGPPEAKILVTPAHPFPGDKLKIENISPGEVSSCALWVTEEPWPWSTAIAGTSELTGKCQRELTFSISVSEPEANYWVHLIVENSRFPFISPNETPEQITSSRIVVDLQPKGFARWVISPAPSPKSPRLFGVAISLLVILFVIAVWRSFGKPLRVIVKRLVLRLTGLIFPSKVSRECEPEQSKRNLDSDHPPGDPIVERLDTIIALFEKYSEKDLWDRAYVVCTFITTFITVISYFGRP